MFPTLTMFSRSPHSAGRKISTRGALTLFVMLACAFLALAAANPAHALDLTDAAGIGGPLQGAIQTLADMSDGFRAIVGFVAFVVALISMTALRNFSPVLSYVGVAIFGAIGLGVGGSVLGAVI